MIELDIDGFIAVMKLNNPPVNAICSELLDELDKKLDELGEGEVRCLILTGEGKHFAAGADIKEMKDMSPPEAEKFSKKGQGVFQRIRELPMPSVAAVSGFALGGGMELAMSCDLIICSEGATFGQPEVGLGVIPGFGGTQRLESFVGKPFAKELIFTGRNVDSQEASEKGLVNKVVEEDVLDAAIDIAEKISSNGPLAVRYAKKAIDGDSDQDFKTESVEFSRCFETQDQKEGMEAFLDKRKADFQGK